jgi:hypothetical protein
MRERLPLVTFGHGTATEEEMLALLTGAGVTSLVDVRTAPGSRRHPHVARERLAGWLPAGGVAYRWEPRLGGFRKAPPDSPDHVWRNDSFRGYASWMRSPDFVAAADELLAGSAEATTAIMCSESLWWRCHRRLVADFAVVARDVPVVHLLHDGRIDSHRPTEGVRRREDGLLVYDGGQPALEAPLTDRKAGTPAVRPTADEGGNAACWLDRVCPECGAFVEGPACWRCGRAAP